MNTLPLNQPHVASAVPLTPLATGLHHSPPAAHPPAVNLCPLCRATMRLWALDARFAPTDGMAEVCTRTARSFRDQCCHTDRERFEAIEAKLAKLTRCETRLRMRLWAELERIKNCNGGHRPAGRTFNAWQERRLA
jgi:hypothetical protein